MFRVNKVQKISIKQDDDDETKEERFKCYQRSKILEKSFKPLLLSMTAMGMFFKRNFKECQGYDPEKSSTNQNRKTKRCLGQLYCGFMVVFVCFNSLRICGSLKDYLTGFGPALLMVLLGVVWNVFCATNGLICFQACFRYNGWRKFIIEWARLHPDVADYDLKSLKTIIMRLTVLGWIFVLSNTSICCLAGFYTQLLDIVYWPFESIFILKVLYSICTLLTTALWVFPLLLYFVICNIVVKREFVVFNDTFDKMVDEGHSNATLPLESLRQHHEKICRIVSHADEIVSQFVGCGVVFNIALICMLLYNIVSYPAMLLEMPLLLISHGFWFLGASVYLCIIVVVGACVNNNAHGCFEILHRLNLSNMTCGFGQQLNTFLNRLTGSSIGVSAMGLFVIDKPAILSIVGMLITYFLLLIQFKPPTTSTMSQNSTLAG